MKPKWMKCTGVLSMLLAACMANAAEQKPNLLWITGEDMSARWLGCYGNKQIKTPNFDKLAREGFLYTHCYAHAPVCAPARSGWIMGIHPVSNGTIYMRSLHETPAALTWYPDACGRTDISRPTSRRRTTTRRHGARRALVAVKMRAPAGIS